jgi:hypothetical protein
MSFFEMDQGAASALLAAAAGPPAIAARRGPAGERWLRMRANLMEEACAENNANYSIASSCRCRRPTSRIFEPGR